MVETRCIASVLPAAPHVVEWSRDASRLYCPQPPMRWIGDAMHRVCTLRGGGGMFIFGWDHHPANSRDC